MKFRSNKKLKKHKLEPHHSDINFSINANKRLFTRARINQFENPKANPLGNLPD